MPTAPKPTALMLIALSLLSLEHIALMLIVSYVLSSPWSLQQLC
jgi:hypothetical protein